MQHQKTKRLRKKLPIQIKDLGDTQAVVDLSAFLSAQVKAGNKYNVKVLNKEGQLDQHFVDVELPYWQEIWAPRGIKIRYDRRQRSFFLTVIR
jgi:hypothetical protein